MTPSEFTMLVKNAVAEECHCVTSYTQHPGEMTLEELARVKVRLLNLAEIATAEGRCEAEKPAAQRPPQFRREDRPTNDRKQQSGGDS